MRSESPAQALSFYWPSFRDQDWASPPAIPAVEDLDSWPAANPLANHSRLLDWPDKGWHQQTHNGIRSIRW
jgi:hypothetical protein